MENEAKKQNWLNIDWTAIGVVLAIIVASVSATLFISGESADIRNETTASIQELNSNIGSKIEILTDMIIEFRTEFKDEIREMDKRISNDLNIIKDDIREIKGEIKIIESRLENHETRLVELE